jgi:hypothetical protein
VKSGTTWRANTRENPLLFRSSLLTSYSLVPMLSEGLYALLASSDSVTAITGTAQTRKDQTTGIFPGQMPESTPLPALVYSQLAASGLTSLDGANVFHTARMQFTCYGSAYADAKRLASAIKTALEGLHQTLPDGTEVDHAELNGELDQFEDAPYSFSTALDLTFAFRETT